MKTILIVFLVIFIPLFLFAGYAGIKATKGLERRKLTKEEKLAAQMRDGPSDGPTDLGDLP
jgi:hypothetical protein